MPVVLHSGARSAAWPWGARRHPGVAGWSCAPGRTN